MTPERWQQIDKLLDQVAEQEPSRRAAFLDEVCAGDQELRRELESLLVYHNKAEQLLDRPALEFTAKKLAAEPPSLLGQQLGPYKIVSLLGAGGMGVVYQAKDDRIGRNVALKVLASEFSKDTDRLRRFEQEARAAGRLNHPNILALYDVGSHEESLYIVSELLNGQTLRDRLTGKALPVQKAIDLALQMARGLAAAHEAGIVHRDLKPENLFITTDERVKILDFGLVKLQPKRAKVPDTGVSTETFILGTEPGVVLGTAGYMSPEQVRGESVDHRSDIFAFGAILYEMLSGQRAFHAKSSVEMMNAILNQDSPELSKANPPIPKSLAHTVTHCLEKSPERRFQSAHDLAFNLEELTHSSLSTSEQSASPLTRPGHRELVAWCLVGLSLFVLVTVLLLSGAGFRRSSIDRHAIRFIVNPPEKSRFVGSLALSPDSQWLAFVASTTGSGIEGRQTLWLRRLDALSAHELPGTEDASYPFWSPDSRFIGFFAQRKLKKIAVSGGPIQILADAPFPSGGTWNRDGVIVFAPNYLDPLYRVSSGGGEPTPVTKVSKEQKEAHQWPHFLPDGRHFLYLNWHNPLLGPHERDAISIGSIESKDFRSDVLVASSSGVVYAPSGFLFFTREKTLYQQAFDAKRLQLIGEPTPLAEGLARTGGMGYADFSVSENDLAYRKANAFNSQFTWFDRKGKTLATVGQPGLYYEPSLSPDEKQVAVSREYPEDPDAADIWVIDLLRGNPRRLTFDPHPDTFPIWSADGSRIVFSSNRNGFLELYQKSSTGADEEGLLLETHTSKRATDSSRDGRWIVYQEVNTKTNRDLFVLPLFGDRRPRVFLQTQFNERLGRLSPDGKWIAYSSNESGKFEIYVQPFPPTGGKSQISTKGGHQPSWRRDGRELFFVADDRTLMAVEVDAAPPNFRAGRPEALFQMRAADSDPPYFAAANGQRFLVNTLTGEATPSQITVVANWSAEVNR